MANSLLAHLYSRIRGSQEDIATFALHYLLSQSKILNRTFTKQVSDCFRIELEESLHYNYQSVGENRERPDMVGTNQAGQELVLFEMKFYAGLTQNQPLGYIDRLKKNGGKGLVFICPQARQTVLWSKLCNLCAERNTEFIRDRLACVDGVYMSILTWAEVIEELERAATSMEPEYISDIYQLKGYCAQMDSDAFIPFTSQDITADNAKKIQRYYQVVDETINKLLTDSNVSSVKTGRSKDYCYENYRIGYERTVCIDNLLVFVSYDHALWKNNSSIETPFWLCIANEDEEQTDVFFEQLWQIDNEKKDIDTWSLYHFALEPLTDATLDEVCEDLKSQIYQYLDIFRGKNI